ncbi:MAG: family 16 glycosylhydrolase, partial [Bacteroidales bacterium]|nr:family 16 glycosylhydrolase [Bacteroidales bacterium]
MSIDKMRTMLAVLSLILLAVACQTPVTPDDPTPEPPTLSFAASSLAVDAEGGEASVRVTSSSAWSVSADGQDWFRLSSPSQIYSGESIVKVTAEPNNTSADRTGTLRFTSGSTTRQLTVNQPHFVPQLSFSADEVRGAGAGGEATVSTSANAVWEAEASDLEWWFSLSPKTIVKGEGEIKVRFNRSYTAQERRASVRFRSGSQEKTLTIVQLAGEPVENGAYVPEGYQLVWQDDFSDPSDKLVSKWRYEDWAPGRVNHELQRYVPDDRRTSYTQDGALYIVARKAEGQVISARMNSRESWFYGYFEAAIWLPRGKGTWPAFWMMPDDQSKGWPACGEIDIMEEVGVDADITSSSIHCEAYNHVKNTQKTASRTT